MLNLSLESELKSLCIFIFVILIFNAYFDFIIECFYIFKHFYMVKMSLQTKEYSCKFSYKGIVKKIQQG